MERRDVGSVTVTEISVDRQGFPGEWGWEGRLLGTWFFRQRWKSRYRVERRRREYFRRGKKKKKQKRVRFSIASYVTGARTQSHTRGSRTDGRTDGLTNGRVASSTNHTAAARFPWTQTQAAAVAAAVVANRTVLKCCASYTQRCTAHGKLGTETRAGCVDRPVDDTRGHERENVQVQDGRANKRVRGRRPRTVGVRCGSMIYKDVINYACVRACVRA